MRVLTRACNRLLTATVLCMIGQMALINHSVWAQVPAPKPPTTPDAPQTAPPVVQRLDYVIVKEDVIEIQVLNHADYSRTLTVDPTGFVDYPILGIYKAEGKKLGDFRTDILKALKKRFINPEVSIAVRSRPPKFVTIFGSVAAKGKLQYKDGWHVLDVIAAAGGVVGAVGSTNRYDLYTITLQRAKTGETISIDPVKLFAGDESQNYAINEDDVLTVYERPTTELQLQVQGQVKNPSAVPVPLNRSIRDVLLVVGNPTDIAQLSKAFIRRKEKNGQEQVIGVDLRGYTAQGYEPRLDSKESFAQKRPVYKQGGDGAPLQMQGGDVLVIPDNRDRYYLLGKFGSGGEKIYPDDRTITLFDAISQSGGVTDGAEFKKTIITRKDPGEPAAASQLVKDGWTKTAGEGGATVYTKTINVEEMFKTGNRINDIALVPGDQVYVKQSGGRRGMSFGEITGIITGLSTLYFLYQQIK